MNARRNRSSQTESDRGSTKRRKAPRGGLPKLGLWEVGVGSVLWKRP